MLAATGGWAGRRCCPRAAPAMCTLQVLSARCRGALSHPFPSQSWEGSPGRRRARDGPAADRGGVGGTTVCQAASRSRARRAAGGDSAEADAATPAGTRRTRVKARISYLWTRREQIGSPRRCDIRHARQLRPGGVGDAAVCEAASRSRAGKGALIFPCPSSRIRRETKEEEMRNSVFCPAFENGRGCGTHTATASFSVPPPGQLGLPACDDAASVSHANL